MKTITQTRATPAILSYLCTSTTHDGEPHSRIACVLLMNGQNAERLLERWNLEGKRTGHTYACQNITHYSGTTAAVPKRRNGFKRPTASTMHRFHALRNPQPSFSPH